MSFFVLFGDVSFQSSAGSCSVVTQVTFVCILHNLFLQNLQSLNHWFKFEDDCQQDQNCACNSFSKLVEGKTFARLWVSERASLFNSFTSAAIISQRILINCDHGELVFHRFVMLEAAPWYLECWCARVVHLQCTLILATRRQPALTKGKVR